MTTPTAKLRSLELFYSLLTPAQLRVWHARGYIVDTVLEMVELGGVSMNLREEEGWVGVFTRDTYDGCMPSGTRVVKVNSEEGDGHLDGEYGTVLGSIGHPELPMVFYFVEWDSSPRRAVGTINYKLQEVT